MTSDGYIKVFDRKSMKQTISMKRHKLPVTSMGFMHDSNGDAEYVLSGSADYTYNIIRCKESLIGKLFKCF